MTTESQSALKILKGKRGSIKASLTKFNTYLNSVNEDNANPTQIKARLVKTKELWSDFFDINAQIKALEQDENNDIEEQHFDDSYFNVITFAEELLAQHPSGSQESSGNRKRDIEGQVRLPRIELPSFSGAFDQWLPFYETFKSLIESNDTINQVQKFHYLKSCLKGEAANCVKELQISDKNYDIAWTTLKERYDNKKLIIQKHIQAIHELPACKGENSGVLRQIIDGVQKHTRSLKALERPVEHWDDWLVYLIGSKIDHSSIKEWESTINANTIPTFKEMVEFLSRKCNTLETIMKSTNNQPSKQKTALAHFSNCVSQCFVCKGNHAIYNCPRFLKMGSEQRLKEIRNAKVCHNCFKSGHHQSKCFSSSCKICNQKHNTLLHASDTSKVETHASPAQGEDSKAVLTHTSRLQDMSRVLLSTAIVKIKDASGLFHKCRVLLDSGSQSNFICKALALKLNLKPNSVNIPVIGIGQSRSQITQTVEVSIKSQQKALSMNLNCFILETITNDVPSSTFNKAALNIPQNLRLADPEFHVSRKIDLLIGAELFWQLICIGRISVANTQLILQKTKLGWIISGPIMCNDYLPSSTICNSAITQPLESIITKFWEIEECPKKAAYTAEELACENHFVETHTRNSEGRFIVKLPVKTDPNQCLGDSRDQAVKRFHSLERKLLKQPELRKQYIDFIDEYIELKHMKPVAQVNANGERHGQFYLPHHAVLKSDSLTTKLRVVFDGSAKSSSGHSLNNILMAGPVVQQDLFSITCRFRTHNIVLTADIEKMYRQVLVDESQTPLQQIIWRSDPSEQLKTYQLTTVTYGTTSASFLAVRALKQLAIDEAEEFPVASRITQSDFYVDDLLTGADSETDVRLIFKEINALLNKGGFRLRKWASNCPHILSELLPDATEPTILKLDKSASLKTLGLQWNSSKDMLEYTIPLYTAKGRITKRTVLSQIAQIFDPLGLIGPNTVRAKLFMQKLWQQKISWDESLPVSLHTEWISYQEDLVSLNTLQVKRNVAPYKHAVQVHGFCDASEKAYGACIYLRCSNNNGEISCEILCSKSRVAPLKVTTIPRLELCAALLLAQLMEKILPALNLHLDDVYYWTDSTIVLGWINTTARQLKTFVANRVAEIQEKTDVRKWNHVSTSENPADILSRGASPDQLMNFQLWWNGPTWLMCTSEKWPKTTTKLDEIEVPEKRENEVISNVITYMAFDLFEQYSTFSKLQRILTYCRRFINNLLHRTRKRDTGTYTGPLTTRELESTTMFLVKVTQAAAFPQELHSLCHQQDIKTDSKIRSLSPFVDNSGLIRVGGRLRNANCSYNQRHPFILPSKHAFTKLLIEHTHRSELHAGTQATLGKLRTKFWPIAGRSTVRQIIRDCITCFKVNPSSHQPKMGDLPKVRVEPARPFINTGIDYCGPFMVRPSASRRARPIKTYVAIFICMAVKAVHIELVSSLDATAFLNALKRFLARRGMVSNIYSDNGSNFVRANKELRELHNLFQNTEGEVIANTLAAEGISWHFNPPRAPHFGGIWEAAVKSFKQHFKRIVGNALLTFEEMSTVITQIEAVLNSRPLIPLSEDPNDLTILTPAHFLIGDSLRSNLEPNLLSLNVNRLTRLQLIEQLRQHLWKRWSKDYLQCLQQRNKWTKNSSVGLNVGQLVIIKEDNSPPLLWSMGRVVETHPGNDGVTRAATVRTSRGEVRRPANKLCLLPMNNDIK